MSCTPNYIECMTREQKEELAERRMREMKEKNEKYLKRYTEVEHDRMEAESRNSAITNVPKGPKKDNKHETYKTESKVEHAREWDRGKPDKDNWKSPEHRGSFKNYRSGRYEKKDIWSNSSRNEGNDSWHDYTSGGHPERKDVDRSDSWGNYSRNENSDHYRHDRSSEIGQNRKTRGNYRYKQYDDQQNSRLHKSPKRVRGVGYRNNELNRNSQHSYSDEKYKRSDYNRSNSRKKYSYRGHSRSSSRSESDFVANNISNAPISSIRASSLWQNDKISEDQTKQTRVEKWVKSVNKSNWGRGKPFPTDQKEKNRSRSYSKFDRFDHSSAESSDENNYLPNFASGEKSRENNNTVSQKSEYHLNKQQNTGALLFFLGSNSPKQVDRGRGFRTKRSPQYVSTSSGKSDQFRKRRFDNKGFKNDEKNKFVKCVMQDNNDSWNSSAAENRFLKKENKNFGNVDAWNQGNDSWGNAVQSQSNEDTWQTADKSQADDGWETADKSQADDGWETAEQSDIKWKLSDEETDFKQSEGKSVKQVFTKKNSSDSWENNFNSEKVKLKEKYQNDKQEVTQLDDPEDTWAHCQQVKGNLKSAAAEGKNEATDDWEDCEPSSINEISEQMQKKCKIVDKMEAEGTVSGKMPQKGSNLNVKAIKQEQSSSTFSEKSHEKNAAGSDGWSTVSEEGEIHSDEDHDTEWKKDSDNIK